MFKVFKEIIHLLDKRSKKILPVSFLMIVVSTIFETLGITLVLPLVSSIIDENIITNNSTVGALCNFFNITTHKTLVITCVISLILVFIFKNVFSLFECKVRYNFICNARHLVQRKIFDSILDRPYEYFLNVQTGEVIRQVADDCNRTFSLFGALLDVFANSLLALGIAIVLTIIDPIMMLIVIALLAVLSVTLILIVKPILKKQGKTLVEYATKNYKDVLEAVQGIKVVKITKSKDFFNESFKRNGLKVIEADRKNTVINKIPFLLTETVCVITVLAYVLVMYLQGGDMAKLIPACGAFVVASLKLVPAVNKILNAYSSVAFNKASVDKVIANYSSIVTKEKGEIKRINLTKSIQLKNVTYKYPNTDRYILNKASLTIPVGKSIGIMGLSGIGKTTSADILLGLLIPESGEILFDDKAMKIDIENYPIQIGYVPQSIFIRDDTIKNNIAFGIEEDKIDETKILECVKAAQLDEFVSSLPEGINTFIGENGVRISGGQRQRIGIARALYLNPELIIFDEATSSLDLQTEDHIIKSIEALHGLKTMIIITHRPQVIKNCDFKYRLIEGKFINEQ